MISFVKYKYNDLPLISIMVSNALDPIDYDTEAVMNLLSKKYDFPLSMYLNPSSLDLNFNKKLKYTCDANNYILLPAYIYNYDKLLTQGELQGYVNILNKNKIPFKFTIDLNHINHYSEFDIFTRMRFIAQLLKSNNGLVMVFYINNFYLSDFKSNLKDVRYLIRALDEYCWIYVEYLIRALCTKYLLDRYT